jgi:hypothetical protein
VSVHDRDFPRGRLARSLLRLLRPTFTKTIVAKPTSVCAVEHVNYLEERAPQSICLQNLRGANHRTPGSHSSTWTVSVAQRDPLCIASAPLATAMPTTAVELSAWQGNRFELAEARRISLGVEADAGRAPSGLICPSGPTHVRALHARRSNGPPDVHGRGVIPDGGVASTPGRGRGASISD